MRSIEVGSDERDGNIDQIYRKTKDSHLLVSILIATVTFAAGLTMPGGYVTDKGHGQGTAILIRSKAFRAFAVTNTLALVMSSSSVFIHIFLELLDSKWLLLPHYRQMWISTISSMLLMMIAYVTGTYAVLDHSSGFTIAYIVSSILLLVILILIAKCFLKYITSFKNVALLGDIA